MHKTNQPWINLGLRLGTSVVSLFFLAGVVNKLVQPLQTLAHLPLSQGIHAQAVVILAAELLLGCWLLIKPARWVCWSSLGMLGLFNVYLLFLWHKQSPSCHCFDALGWTRSPAQALLCNLFLMLFLCLWLSQKPKTTAHLRILPSLLLSLGGALALWTVSAWQWLNPSQPMTTANSPVIVLKMNPQCASCWQFTQELLEHWPPAKIQAVTLQTNHSQLLNFQKVFGIPVQPVSLEAFFALGNSMEIPDAYRKTNETWERIQFHRPERPARP